MANNNLLTPKDVEHPQQSKNYKRWPYKGATEPGPIKALAGATASSAKLIAKGYKNIGKAIGEGAGRMVYGKIAETPKSVRPNTKRKK